MDVFITGATGFVGRKLLEFIENDERFENIYCLCRKATDFSSRVNVIVGSLDELQNIPGIKADVCLHLAAITDSSSADKKDIFKINAEGTEALVDFCKRSGIPQIVFVSSVNVYLKKKYSYALSKLYAEECIKKSDVRYSILRCSLVYGPDCPSFEKIIRFADLFHLVPVLGPGRSYKQPIYIDEVCNEIIRQAFLSDENMICDLYGKTKMTYNEMVKAIIAVNCKRAFLVHLPITPFRIISEFCYKFNIPFPVYPEQISHMCENLCAEKAFDNARLDEFQSNLHKYIRP